MAKRQLIINYVPGEECRVAVVNDGKLDEFYSEKTDSVSHVGNIYVGRVTNVEPAISAAFVDFGLEASGFLHVSDLHPRYFPGESKNTKERVGKKTPRRERPPINEALKRGQEIIVQILKEGVGSKGPMLTTYLSIPGRYLVMMPGMDRTGVSRKVEDEEQRAKMKAILDQLDLPEEFGFILRTAGFDRNKTELKRDLAYLLRLEKEMDKRRKTGGKPRLLYSEGDLLIRALRDMLTTDTEQVIIDDEEAVKRASKFMKIVSPRTLTKLFHYKGHTPVFHALSLQDQIKSIYSREVPLPSGGRLVIDETEALVAIDVNSGKSRSAGDSEDNAYRTNLEAAEEICRQLRLRDLGGIVVNDLIDMRLAKHRKDVEGRFESILREDRAKSTVAPISEFGLLEMTRQRMRSSHESLHFTACPTCHGRGLVQKADSVAADGLRELAGMLDQVKVKKIEMVVHPRVGAELLSGKRRWLARLERNSAKQIDVRLSDATAIDRVTFYAYDDSNNDLELDRLPKFKLTDELLVLYEKPDEAALAEEEDSIAIDPLAEAARSVLSLDAPPMAGPNAPSHAIEVELTPADLGRVRERPAAGVSGGEPVGRGGRRGRAGSAPRPVLGAPPEAPNRAPFAGRPPMIGPGGVPVVMGDHGDGAPPVEFDPNELPPALRDGQNAMEQPMADGSASDGEGGRRGRRGRRGGRGRNRVRDDGPLNTPPIPQGSEFPPAAGVDGDDLGAPLPERAPQPPMAGPGGFTGGRPSAPPQGQRMMAPPVAGQARSPYPPRPPAPRPPQGRAPAPPIPANSLAARFRSDTPPPARPSAQPPIDLNAIGEPVAYDGPMPPPIPPAPSRGGGRNGSDIDDGFEDGPGGQYDDQGGPVFDEFGNPMNSELGGGRRRRRRRRRRGSGSDGPGGPDGGADSGPDSGPAGGPTGGQYAPGPAQGQGQGPRQGPGPGQYQGQNQPPNQRGGPRQDQRGDGSGQRFVGPAVPPRSRPVPPRAPAPPPPPPAPAASATPSSPPSGPVPAKKPRPGGLYSSFRRLKPGEAGKVKRDE